MSSRALITYSASRTALCIVSLPLFSFIFCIVYSLLFNFADSTSTHCKVTNLLPSISAAIGNFSPQKYVWRAGVGIHSAPRFLYAWLYRGFYANQLPTHYNWLADLVFAFQFLEDLALLGLTMVSSSENYPVHEKCFITFLLCSTLYMLVCAFVIPRLSVRQGVKQRASLAFKRKACYASILASAVAALSFYRHNSHCEPYMYTIFAAAEYIIVMCNMAFHATAYFDFEGASIVVGKSDEDSSPLIKNAIS